jgi:glyoxylase-like metal-dependent hydrolase (beta-lactamase superfamily II)
VLAVLLHAFIIILEFDCRLGGRPGKGMRIAHVTETHIHADYLSGTRELAQATEATVHLSGEGGAD